MSGRGLSVVVVSFRTGPSLQPCLEALLGQPGLAEVILVDNGNHPRESRYLDELAMAQGKLKLLRQERNLGFAAGCNLGASQATGDFLALVNPDLVVPLGSFERILDILKAHPNAWLCGARLSNLDGSEQRGGRRDTATPWRALAEVLRLNRLFPNHPHFRRMHMHEMPPLCGVAEVPTVSGAFMVLEMERWRRLGGMDEEMFLHMEDADLCLRILKAGGSVLYCAEVPVYHHLSTSDVSKIFVEWHKAKSGARYFRKHFSHAYPAWALTFINAALWARWLVLALAYLPGDLRRLLPFAGGR